MPQAFLIYGKAGTGKTLLAESLGVSVLELAKRPGVSLLTEKTRRWVATVRMHLNCSFEVAIVCDKQDIECLKKLAKEYNFRTFVIESKEFNK